jgi:hypothetical protein
MIEYIANSRPVDMRFVEWGTFGPHGSPNYYIRGFATYYENGVVVVAGGGGASGHDIMDLYILEREDEETWKILGSWDETR